MKRLEVRREPPLGFLSPAQPEDGEIFPATTLRTNTLASSSVLRKQIVSVLLYPAELPKEIYHLMSDSFSMNFECINL